MYTIHLLISGNVQGVFYRAAAKQRADKIGITGWIKNTTDNKVEAVVTGTQPQLAAFVEWCRKGPELACVEGVIETVCNTQKFSDFTIIR